MKFKIAVVQFGINQLDPKINLKKAEEFIKYASGKADIIIFPEYFLTGGLDDKEMARYVDYGGKYREKFQQLAKKYKINVVAGSFIEGTQTGKYNTSYFIDSSGKVRAIYKKINLWLTERGHTTHGNEICVFNTKYGKCGIVICWDLMFPETIRALAKRGVRIVFCPSLWYKGIGFKPYIKYNLNAEADHVNALCLARAVENNIILIFSNSVGKLKTSASDFDEAIGQSQITVPIKGALQKFDDKTEKMFIQEVNTAILKDAEKAYGIRSDLKKRILY